MTIATMTSKGQITIPKDVRERLHLRTGDKVDFRVQHDGTVRLHPVTKTVAEAFGAFSHKAARAVTTEEMDERLRQAFRDGKL